MAGVLSAVLIAAAGVVFTDWYNARGSDTIGRLAGQGPLTIGYVAVDTGLRHLALREPVTDPQERAVLQAGAADAEREVVLARHRVAPVGGVDLTVVLVGNRSSVRIVDIEPRVLTREPVSRGTLLIPASAGEAGTIQVSADLDDRAPSFRMAGDRKVAYFRSKQIDLKRDERVTLSMAIEGEKAFYEFDLLATVLAEARTEQVVVKGPDGQPFRITGSAKTYRSSYHESPLGGWQPVPHKQVCADRSAAEGC
ncbi:hypothetical protein ACU635_34890 [[Actinomadura] parvosata]|uniref:hypothetical protein n=1 Tax=[Actinomadura] parvosata TaxID=1955412 RepID=UPI00406D079B